MNQQEIHFSQWLKTKNFRYSVIAGIVASGIFVLFIYPIISSFWNIILWVSSFFWDGFLDLIYGSAALGQRNHFSFMILMVIVSPLIGISIFKIFDTFSFKKKDLNKYDETPSIFKKIRDVIIGLLIILSVLTILSSGFADLQYNTSFNQRLTVLAPYISDQQYKEIRSSWARMRTRHDYLCINIKLEQLAEENNIELPKPLLN